MLGIILGGGAGTRLYPLTKKRAKPAVPLGANYRLIDIPVSNCLNSNITKIYCLTQFNSASLNRHLSQAYVSTIRSGMGLLNPGLWPMPLLDYWRRTRRNTTNVRNNSEGNPGEGPSFY